MPSDDHQGTGRRLLDKQTSALVQLAAVIRDAAKGDRRLFLGTRSGYLDLDYYLKLWMEDNFVRVCKELKQTIVDDALTLEQVTSAEMRELLSTPDFDSDQSAKSTTEEEDRNDEDSRTTGR